MPIYYPKWMKFKPPWGMFLCSIHQNNGHSLYRAALFLSSWTLLLSFIPAKKPIKKKKNYKQLAILSKAVQPTFLACYRSLWFFQSNLGKDDFRETKSFLTWKKKNGTVVWTVRWGVLSYDVVLPTSAASAVLWEKDHCRHIFPPLQGICVLIPRAWEYVTLPDHRGFAHWLSQEYWFGERTPDFLSGPSVF